ncbi:hypothetical protein Agub_g3098, partial [Astrephomene gubernaculifera]
MVLPVRCSLRAKAPLQLVVRLPGTFNGHPADRQRTAIGARSDYLQSFDVRTCLFADGTNPPRPALLIIQGGGNGLGSETPTTADVPRPWRTPSVHQQLGRRSTAAAAAAAAAASPASAAAASSSSCAAAALTIAASSLGGLDASAAEAAESSAPGAPAP